MSNNLYPDDAPHTRRKGRRKPRPKHLPPYVPAPAPVDPSFAAAATATKAVAAAAPPPSFGARPGAAAALRFHQLKSGPLPPPQTAPGAGADPGATPEAPTGLETPPKAS